LGLCRRADLRAANRVPFDTLFRGASEQIKRSEGPWTEGWVARRRLPGLDENGTHPSRGRRRGSRRAQRGRAGGGRARRGDSLDHRRGPRRGSPRSARRGRARGDARRCHGGIRPGPDAGSRFPHAAADQAGLVRSGTGAVTAYASHRACRRACLPSGERGPAGSGLPGLSAEPIGQGRGVLGNAANLMIRRVSTFREADPDRVIRSRVRRPARAPWERRSRARGVARPRPVSGSRAAERSRSKPRARSRRRCDFRPIDPCTLAHGSNSAARA
jgi:hypothetical protein